MGPVLSIISNFVPRRGPARWRTHLSAAALAAALLAACGGGGGGDNDTAPPAAADGSLDDPTAYSSAPNAALAGAVEAAATRSGVATVDGVAIAYTAKAGHVVAIDTLGVPQASVFYAAYLKDGADPATRPVTFFYNGGPGSASAWLQIGSFGPRRLATGVPAMTAQRPFALVDNAETLLDVTDLVYVNAVGTGYSQALAPYTNSSFWGVDADARVFRDAVRRWLALHARTASPVFLYGESYGGPRSAVLARRLQESGVAVTGVVLQSPALDYNANCDVVATVTCAGFVPGYAATGLWHARVAAPADPDAWLAGITAWSAGPVDAAMRAWLTSGTPTPAIWPDLAAATGLPAGDWAADINVRPTPFRNKLLTGQSLGRYDARMAAPIGSALAVGGDPSIAWVASSFTQRVVEHLRDEIGYRNASTYVMLSAAIETWDFSHDGRPLPDTVPDLAAALAADPALQVLAIAGRHDLATPFAVTIGDMERLASPRARTVHYDGGHMSYLDAATRVRQKADLAAFYAAALAARATVSSKGRSEAAAAAARRPATEPMVVGVWPPPPAKPRAAEPAVQGIYCDPCVPARAAVVPPR